MLNRWEISLFYSLGSAHAFDVQNNYPAIKTARLSSE